AVGVLNIDEDRMVLGRLGGRRNGWGDNYVDIAEGVEKILANQGADLVAADVVLGQQQVAHLGKIPNVDSKLGGAVVEPFVMVGGGLGHHDTDEGPRGVFDMRELDLSHVHAELRQLTDAVLDQPLNTGLHVIEEVLLGNAELHSLDVSAE